MLILALILVEEGQIVQNGGGIKMIGAKCVFVDQQGTLEERLGLLVLPLILVEEGQIVQATGCVGMIRVKRLFLDVNSSLVEEISLLISATSIVGSCQVFRLPQAGRNQGHRACGGTEMVRDKHVFVAV